MSTAPEVTIVIPTRNRVDWLPATIDSARNASSNAEIIVVDDASTDETSRVCAEMDGVRYIRLDENVGTSAARNLAIREARADLIAFLDDDDLRLPGSLDGQVALMKRYPETGMVYGKSFLGEWRFSLPIGLVVPEECPRGDLYWSLLEGNFIATSTVVARRQTLIEAGLFDPQLDVLEDYDLWIRMAERSWIDVIAEPVSVYRVRGEASGQKTSNRAHHEGRHKMLHKKLLSRGRAADASWWRRQRTHSRHMNIIYGSLIHDSALALVNGDGRSAREYLLAAARLSPLHLKAHVSLLWLLARDLVRRFR